MKLQYFYSPPLVSYLIMNGLPLIKTSKHKETNKIVFYFEKGERLEEVIGKWKKDSYLKEYLGCMNKVKQML